MSEVRIVPTEFVSEGGTVRGNFVLPLGRGPFPGICKYHGFPGSPDQTSGIATRLAEAGFAVLTFDFRGFRKSDGLFRISGEMKDAANAVTHLLDSDFVLKGWAGVLGASFGGAIAVCSAAEDQRVNAVCIRAPVFDMRFFSRKEIAGPAMDAIYEMGTELMHGLEDRSTRIQLVDWMDEESKVYRPLDEVSKISPRPLFIITGDEDQLIDVGGVKHLYEAAKDPKDLVIVEGADHGPSDPRADELTKRSIVDWFLKIHKKSKVES